MIKRAILTGLAVFLIGFLALAEDKPMDETKLIQGNWDWDPAAKQSEAKPQVLLNRVVIVNDSLTFHYSLDGKKFQTPTKFTLDSKPWPKEIDFTPTEMDNPNKGKKYLGLYEFKAGQLKICYRGPGSTRPKNFQDSFEGTNLTTFISLKPSPNS